MTPEERVRIRQTPGYGEYLEVIVKGDWREVHWAGDGAQRGHDYVRATIAEAVADAKDTLRSELAETQRQWGRLEDTWLELAEQHAALKEKQAAEIVDARTAEQKRCCEAIRAACITCKGTGNKITGGGHLLGECHLCGSLIAAIRKPPAENEPVIEEATTYSGYTDAFEHGVADENKRCCEAIRAACECCDGDGQHDWLDGEVLACTHCEWPIAAIRKPPAGSEVRAALNDAIDNADKPRPGSKAEAAIEKLHNDRRLTFEEMNRPCAESDDGHNQVGEGEQTTCTQCQGTGKVALRDPSKCTNCGADNLSGGMGLCNSCYRSCWKDTKAVDDAERERREPSGEIHSSMQG